VGVAFYATLRAGRAKEQPGRPDKNAIK